MKWCDKCGNEKRLIGVEMGKHVWTCDTCGTKTHKTYKELGTEIGALVDEKNSAYGNSFAKCGDFLKLLYPDGIRPEQYTDALCLVRIFDKQMRIATRKDAFGESPFRDITGYGLLGVMKDEG